LKYKQTTDNTVASKAFVALEDEIAANPFDFSFETSTVANYAYVN